jgi:RHS repeat-associated protein
MTSLVLDALGDKVAESRHFPYGGERWRWPEGGTFPTDYRFTGQRWEQPLGIYTMGARWYDPALGRWLSADTLVPDPGNPQAFNRYSYAGGNPVRYRDPSGHFWETLWDIGNVIWDIYEVKKDPSLLNIGCLVVDVAAAALPIVPAGAGLIARGGKAAKVGVEVATHADEAVDAARLLSHADDLVDAAKAVDEGVAAFRAYKGGGIHPASTGKAFSDWFKKNILKNTAAKGKNIWGGARRLDIVDDAVETIFELKNYTPETSIGKAFWLQAEDYVTYAGDVGYTLKYVFGQKIGDSVFQRLVDMGIEVWYIDDTGEMVQWVLAH